MQAASGAKPAIGAAQSIVEDAWNELQRSPFVQRQLGLPLRRLPDVSLAEAERKSAAGRSLLRRLDALDTRALPHDLALTLRLVRFRAQSWSREAEWYWTAIDPLGIGWFGLFLPTAYCGGWVLTLANEHLESFRFAEATDCDRYLALIEDYARLIDEFTARTAGQAQRGMRMPQVQARQALNLLGRFKSRARAVVAVDPRRYASVQRSRFARDLESRIAKLIEPAFDRATEQLSASYLAAAPEAVGLGQYPGGQNVYSDLTRFYTTLDLTPEEVHERGNARMAQIEEQMRTVRNEMGFAGDNAAFLAHLECDPSWHADTGEGVTAVFQRYSDRLKPIFHKYFRVAPKASYSVVPLPEELQGSMTYGYYDAPGNAHADGRYFFNARNLTKRALFTLGSLTYHELLPGHHLHLALQLENESLHPFRKYSLVNAYNEGWAEYAAALAGEIGLYERPEERYGRLVMDAFLTCRLVVDTGMNALGWSLERARQYTRQRSGMTEAEIVTESIRYSCDVPGQALAYKLGDTEILALRERMKHELAEGFDLKAFHAAVLGPGALPMADLEWHIEHEIKRLKGDGGVSQDEAQ